MSKENAGSFLKLFQEIDFPESPKITEEARALYERGQDILLLYRGHPDMLMQALQVFLATNCRPYALAGAARILLLSSYINGRNNYDKEMVGEGYRYLQTALSMAPRSFEIAIIEPEVHNMLGDVARMRQTLDNLKFYGESSGFRFALVEMWYWDRKNDERQYRMWCDEGFKRAQNDIQRLYVLNHLAGSMLNKRETFKEALALYDRVVKINPRDPWAWHNMSYIFMELRDYANAGACNERALSIMDFGNARHIREKLVNIWSKSRHEDILTDVPRYTSTRNVNQPTRQNAVSFFKKLRDSL